MTYPTGTDWVDFDIANGTDIDSGQHLRTLSHAIPRRVGIWRGNVVVMSSSTSLVFYDGVTGTVTNTVSAINLPQDAFFAVGNQEALADLWMVDNGTWPPVAVIYDVATWTIKNTLEFQYTRRGHTTDGVYGGQQKDGYLYIIADGVGIGGSSDPTPWPCLYRVAVEDVDPTADTLDLGEFVREVVVDDSLEDESVWANFSIMERANYTYFATVEGVNPFDATQLLSTYSANEDPNNATEMFTTFQRFALLQLSDGLMAFEENDSGGTEVTMWGSHTKPEPVVPPFWTNLHNVSVDPGTIESDDSVGDPPFVSTYDKTIICGDSGFSEIGYVSDDNSDLSQQGSISPDNQIDATHVTAIFTSTSFSEHNLDIYMDGAQDVGLFTLTCSLGTFDSSNADVHDPDQNGTETLWRWFSVGEAFVDGESEDLTFELAFPANAP